MPYKLIKGEFHIHYPDAPLSGPEPDGDTLKFLPDNPLLVESLTSPGSSPDFNRRGMINLRFEGIDALETHFRETHQNLNWAEAARDELLSRVGFTDIQFSERDPNKIVAVENHPQRGYVFTNGLDTFGRIIAFVYTGEIAQVDGSMKFLETEDVGNSLNYDLLEAGLAYPAFYTSLPTDLKEVMFQVVRQQRQEGQGLWPESTAHPLQTATLSDGLIAIEDLVIWPKLFRRLVSYAGAGFPDLIHFDRWLREDPVNRDDRVLLPNGELGNMHDVIEVVAPLQLRMRYEPEDLVIVPDNTVLTPLPQPLPPVGKSIHIVAALVNPIGNEAGSERVTLLNSRAQDQDLSGWSLADSAGHAFPLSGTLAAGAVVQITLDYHVRLNNTGDTITLFDEQAHIIDQVSYSRRDAAEEGVTLLF